MAKIFEEYIYTQHSIYDDNNDDKRKIRIRYSLPNRETNTETGILLLIPAYGGNLDSNVYNKMHQVFPDRYNMIVIQCNYFGIDYMSNMTERLPEFAELADIKEGRQWYLKRLVLNESLDNCNDMGIMQGADLIHAMLYIINKLSNKGIVINFGKIISYGSSHGSYLGYVVNRLCPNMIQLIIDNSSYCKPNYLCNPRPILYTPMISEYPFETLLCDVYYLVACKRENFLPDEFYDLNSLYSSFDNKCRVLSFHGSDDDMVSVEEKRNLLNNINYSSLIEISRNDVDGKYFKSSGHGLGVDLLELYEAVNELSNNMFEYKDSLEISEKVVLDGVNDRVVITYNGLTPNVLWEKV